MPDSLVPGKGSMIGSTHTTYRLELIMSTRPFAVADLDLDQPTRHFGDLAKAIGFAVKEARASWTQHDWTVVVRGTPVRILVNVNSHFSILNNGHLVAQGLLSSDGLKPLTNTHGWDVINAATVLAFTS